MLYSKKPNLSQLKEWGSKVWVHTSEGTKLDGRSKEGKWIGYESYDEVSNGHRIYWPDKRSVTIERSIKFDNGDVIVPPILTTGLIQGEKGQKEEEMNQRHVKKSAKEQGRTKSPLETLKLITKESNNNQGNEDLYDQVTNELIASQSQRVRFPTRYVRELVDGTGTADNRVSQPDIPPGLQIPIIAPQIGGEDESEFNGQIETAMATVTSEVEG